jgi:hypothetical protein
MPILITEKYRKRDNFQPKYYNGDETMVQDQFVNRMNSPIGIDILVYDYEQNFMSKLGLGFKTSVVRTDNTLTL